MNFDFGYYLHMTKVTERQRLIDAAVQDFITYKRLNIPSSDSIVSTILNKYNLSNLSDKEISYINRMIDKA